MKQQTLFSMKDKCKNVKMSSATIFVGALRVNNTSHIINYFCSHFVSLGFTEYSKVVVKNNVISLQDTLGAVTLTE